MRSLTIRNLVVKVEGKKILDGVSLSVAPGQIHAIMGPNGSGKSTLAYALMGHPVYKSQIINNKTQIKLDGKDIGRMPTEERARLGLFLAMQSPIAIAGVSMVNLLRTAHQELSGKKSDPDSVQNPILSRRWRGSVSLAQFTQSLKEYAKLVNLDESFLTRGINDGFSGGERKKAEMIQALVLSPKYAIFDEIDTGLDVDALRSVAAGIRTLSKKGAGIVIVTHYQRILRYVTPDVVHVLISGRIVKSSDASLAEKIEKEGYAKYR